ncbi:MAG: Fe-S-binding domain-containing protein, partial [Ignavibacteriales bacterium]
MEQSYLLTYLLAIPVIGSIIILFINKEKFQLIKNVGLIVSLVAFVVSLFIYFGFDNQSSDFQLVNKFDWVKDLNISYHVGIDGLSMLLILLTTFLTPLTLISSWSGIKNKVKEFTFFMLFLELGMLGVFPSLDMFLFYVFWEAMLI